MREEGYCDSSSMGEKSLMGEKEGIIWLVVVAAVAAMVVGVTRMK